MTTIEQHPPAHHITHARQAAWRDRLAGIGRDHGFFARVGWDHLCLFVQEGDTLLVDFDRAARVCNREQDGLPVGFEAVQRKEWSLLSILSLDDHWYRSAELIAFFDGLAASGFFDSFAQVIFLGFGPAAGHAACAYSAAAPGAAVLASAPAARLTPHVIGCDPLMQGARKRDFARYCDAPALIATAREVVIAHDPTDTLSAAHAAQFHGQNVTLAPLRFTGTAPERLIRQGGLLMQFLRSLNHQRLSAARCAALIRPVRRADPDYLWDLLQRAAAQGRPLRARRIADYAADVTGDARFTMQGREGAATPPL